MTVARGRAIVLSPHGLLRAGVVGMINTRTQATVVATLSEAIDPTELLRHSEPDFLLIDLDTPRIDETGFVIQALRARSLLTLIGLCGRTKSKSAVLIRRSRAGLLLPSSAEPDVLIHVVEEVISLRTNPTLRKVGRTIPTESTNRKLTQRQAEVLALAAEGSQTSKSPTLSVYPKARSNGISSTPFERFPLHHGSTPSTALEPSATRSDARTLAMLGHREMYFSIHRVAPAHVHKPLIRSSLQELALRAHGLASKNTKRPDASRRPITSSQRITVVRDGGIR